MIPGVLIPNSISLLFFLNMSTLAHVRQDTQLFALQGCLCGRYSRAALGRVADLDCLVHNLGVPEGVQHALPRSI